MKVSSGQTGETPPSGSTGGPEKSKRGKGEEKKEFALPRKEGENGKEGLVKEKLSPKEEKPEEESTGLFELAATGLEGQKAAMQKVGAEAVTETSKVQGLSPINQVTQLIGKMVDQMQIGKVGETSLINLQLSEKQEVPNAFKGASLTMSYQENGLVIKFDNFTSPQNEQNALFLVEQNKEELQKMLQVLQAKNIQVTELSIGTNTIALPRVEPVPPPFQAPGAGAQLGEGKGERGKDEGGKGEAPPVRPVR